MSDTQKLLSHFYLKVNGQNAPKELMQDVIESRVENSLHLPDVATVILHDPHLRWIDDSRLEPGKPLQVTAKYGDEEKLIFDGEIVEMEPEFGPDTHRLAIRAFDRLHRLSHMRKVRSFVNVTDSDLVNKIASEAKLQVSAGSTPQVHPYILQANETDLAFLQKRAKALGYVLYVQGTTLHFHEPKASDSPVELAWNHTLAEFRPRMTAMAQATSVTVRGWDPGERQPIMGRADKGNGTPKVGEQLVGGELLKSAFNLETEHLVVHRPVRTQAEADQLAQAMADRYAASFIEAEGVCGGHPDVIAGKSVNISAVGSRFSGSYFITSAVHILKGDSYTTEFTISGLNPSSLLSTLQPEETTMASGLVIGIVTDNNDPDQMGRVKVKFPWLTNDHTSYWARVVAVGAGPNRGIQFLPEVNDEVLVGFEQDDINFPYILGGLWNGKDAPPMKNDKALNSGKVQQRMLRSRIGHEITLGEGAGGSDTGFVTITTAGGRKINVTDTDKGILIKSEKNTIELDDQGAGVVSIETPGDVKIKATGKVSIEGQAGVEMKALTVDIKADTSMQIEANATLDMKGSAMVNLQGGLVKIN